MNWYSIRLKKRLDNKQYQAHSTVITVIPARLNYNADASSRQSGSAVHDVNGTVHAIHTAGAGTSNTGIKINAAIFNLFKPYCYWKNKMTDAEYFIECYETFNVSGSYTINQPIFNERRRMNICF